MPGTNLLSYSIPSIPVIGSTVFTGSEVRVQPRWAPSATQRGTAPMAISMRKFAVGVSYSFPERSIEVEHQELRIFAGGEFDALLRGDSGGIAGFKRFAVDGYLSFSQVHPGVTPGFQRVAARSPASSRAR